MTVGLESPPKVLGAFCPNMGGGCGKPEDKAAEFHTHAHTCTHAHVHPWAGTGWEPRFCVQGTLFNLSIISYSCGDSIIVSIKILITEGRLGGSVS